MTTILQKCTDEFESNIENSLVKDNTLNINEIKNEDITKEEILDDTSIEENLEDNGDNIPVETTAIPEIEKSKNCFILRIIFFIVNVIKLFFKSMDSDINSIIEMLARFFGVNQERINRKLIKRLLILFFFIITYVQSSSKTTVYQNFPVNRLFPRHSLVTDFFHGELSLLRNEIFSNDMTVVMYYAPWDRQSQNFAMEFAKAAQYHHEQVTFAAINCWLPKSECKQHYKLQFYPIVVLHVKDSTFEDSFTVPYNGPLSAHHLIRFIDKALHPFTYIANQTDLLSLQLESQVIVLGYYEKQHMKKELLSFYYAALSRLQFEHMTDIVYAVITSSAMAEKQLFLHVPSIHLLLWDNILIFPPSVDMNMRNITSFVDTHRYQVIRWLHISGKKSLALNKVYQDGPFLIIFAPDNPYHFSNDLVQLMRSVSLEYFNCQSIPLISWMAKHFHLKSKAEIRNTDEVCQKYLKSQYEGQSFGLYNIQEGEEESSDTCQMEDGSHMYRFDKPSSMPQFSWSNIWSSFIESEPLTFEWGYCSKQDSSYLCKNRNASDAERTSPINTAWKKFQPEEPMYGGPKEDDKVARMLDKYSEDQCKKIFIGSSVTSPEIPVDDKRSLDVTGLSCETNRTLKFVAIDSLLHNDFAQQLGLDLKKSNPKLSGVLIIDPVMEERYIMEGNLSRNSMATFIYNFTHNRLNRGGIYTELDKTKEECKSGETCVMELNGENYLDVTSKPKQAFVVMHYSHHCGACSAISGVFLTCQHIASNVSNLQFARIDVSKNTLPWHLIFDSVPTIVFHPHDKKQETKILNSKLPVTVKNLMTFILSGLKPAERNSLALKLCNEECRKLVSSQGLLLKVKTHHRISLISSKIKRYIVLLIQTKAQLEDTPNNKYLLAKYNLFSDIKTNLQGKLATLKEKLYHLNRLNTLDLVVPSGY